MMAQVVLEQSDPARDPKAANKWADVYSRARFRREVRAWRMEDVEQRVMDNAELLWERYAESNRRFVEERSEMLKSFANLSALITGFAIVSFLQFDFAVTSIPQGLDLAFGVTMATVVGLSINSMSVCGLIHAAVMKTGKLYVAESEEAEFMRLCRQFALRYQPGARPPQPRRNIQTFWQVHCEDEWQRAFLMFSSSVFVFYVNLTLAAWIKFLPLALASILMTVVFGLGLAFFVVMHVHWLPNILGSGGIIHGPNRKEADSPMGLPFDWHLRPRRLGLSHSSVRLTKLESMQSSHENGHGTPGHPSVHVH